MPDCLFCKIGRDEISSEKFYEDDYTYAILDIHPSSKGHSLIIIRDHFENIYTIPDEELCRWMMSVKKVAIGIKHALDADGINLVMNNEPAAGQLVFHCHMHIVPRFVDDTDFHFGRHLPYKEGEVKEIAEKIRKELEQI
jgi:histidine triad (HIT) family protein